MRRMLESNRIPIFTFWSVCVCACVLVLLILIITLFVLRLLFNIHLSVKLNIYETPQRVNLQWGKLVYCFM